MRPQKCEALSHPVFAPFGAMDHFRFFRLSPIFPAVRIKQKFRLIDGVTDAVLKISPISTIHHNHLEVMCFFFTRTWNYVPNNNGNEQPFRHNQILYMPDLRTSNRNQNEKNMHFVIVMWA